jgi:hypothetical protein
MNFRELGNKFLMSIPHLALLFDMRRNQRYVPHESLGVEIRVNDAQIDGKIFDISFGGIRIISSDKRIEDSKTITMFVDDFRLDLPCKTIRRDESYYGIKFGSMNRQELINLKYFVEHFTKESPENQAIELLK